MSDQGDLTLPDYFFRRQDESPDEIFYSIKRLEKHIDDETIDAVTTYYREALSPEDRLLDLMSSWISHLPVDVSYRHVSGLGMNQEELEKNPRLDEWLVHNLNTEPQMPYADESFDKVMIVVSIQYLTRPFEVFRDIARVLATGGECMVMMSHRLFPTKAIYAFHALGPADRCQLVMHYMDKTGSFSEIELIDRSPANADPLWIVKGKKK